MKSINNQNQLTIEFKDLKVSVLNYERYNKKNTNKHKWQRYKEGYICIKCHCQKSIHKTEKGHITFYNSNSYQCPKCI